MDVHVRRSVTLGLRLRGVDVLTAQEDRSGELSDPDLLDRATKLNRIVFTQDDDLLREANKRNRSGEMFSGVVYAHQLNISVGQCVSELELIAKATDNGAWKNTVVYLPLS